MDLARKKSVFLIILFSLVAGIIRFHNVSTWSIDVDEPSTPWESMSVNGKTILDYFLLDIRNLAADPSVSPGDKIRRSVYKVFPVYFLANKVIIKTLGVSELSLRLLSVLCSIAAIPLLFAFCQRWFNRRVAAIAIVITIFHPFIQFHSQNARFYSMSFMLSILSIMIIFQIDHLLKQEEFKLRDKLYMVLAGIYIPLTLLVHINMIFPSMLLVFVVKEAFFQGKRAVHRLIYLAYALVLPGIVVLLNIIYMLRIRVLVTSAVGDASVFERLKYGVESFVFNFGLTYCLLIPLFFFVCRAERHSVARRFLGGFTLGLTIYFTMFLMSPEIRVDYIFTLMPFFIVLTSYLFDSLVKVIGVKEMLYSSAIPYGLSFFMVMTMAPSFLSNVLIDGDRFDWKRTVGVILADSASGDKVNKVNIYSSFPGNVNYYLDIHGPGIGNFSARHIKEMVTDHRRAAKASTDYIVVPWRRAGFDTKGISRDQMSYIQKNGEFVHLVGKSRYDIHVSRLLVIKIAGLPRHNEIDR